MTKHRPGRPSVDADDESTRLSVTLPTKQYDDLCRQALRDDVSLAEVIRRELRVSGAKNPNR
jgi:hypothetical protein